jgi:long-subunit fatty acid transport protein
MRRSLLTLFAMMVGVYPCFSAFSKGDAGTSAAQFLKLGAGARAAAMGEAFSAVSDNADSVYWNPAGLNKIEGKSLSVMHAAWFEGITYDWAAYAQKVGSIGTFGVGVQYLSYGSINGTDDTGLDTGSFSPSGRALTVSYARQLCGLSLGANVKYISSQIQNTASAYAVDAGAQYALTEKLDLGAVMQNAGTKMKFNNVEETLPFAVKCGAAYRVRPQWALSAEVNAPIDNTPVYSAGTEYRYAIDGRISAAGRLGYTTRTNDTGGLNGVTMGAGFTYLSYSIDYAFVPYGDLGNTHRISLGIVFK